MIDRNYMVTDYIKYNIDECLNLSFIQNINLRVSETNKGDCFDSPLYYFLNHIS